MAPAADALIEREISQGQREHPVITITGRSGRAALGLWRKQFVPQKGDLFLELRHLSVRQQQHLLEQNGIVGKVIGAKFHGAGLYRFRPRSAASVPGAVGYATGRCRRAASSVHRPSVRWPRRRPRVWS